MKNLNSDKKTDRLAEQSSTHALSLAAQDDSPAYWRQATADNTRRAYRNAVRQFETWGGLLPTDETTLVRYLTSQANTTNPRTLSLYLTALSNWHQYQGFPDPTQGVAISKTLAGIARVHGRPKQKAQALRQEEIEKMIVQLEKQTDLRALRDSALIQVAYFGAFRRSELVAITVDDLCFEPEGLLIKIPRSKTDPTGVGKVKALPYGQQRLCPVNALKKWLSASAIKDAYVFRSLTRWGKLSQAALHPSSVNRILKNLAVQCEFDFIDKLSSHSLRRGFATSAARAGANFDAIKRQGGWRNDTTVREYIEEGQLFEDNAAKMLLE